jgi:hypothetical protein
LSEYIRIFVRNISDPTNLFGYSFAKYLAQRIYSYIRSALNKMFVSHCTEATWFGDDTRKFINTAVQEIERDWGVHLRMGELELYS